MLFQIKTLMNANKLSIDMTSAGDTHQITIEADDAVKITLTGTRQEIEDGLIEEIKQRIEEIHKAKKKGLTSSVKPTGKPATPKKESAKPAKKEEAEKEDEEDDENPQEDTGTEVEAPVAEAPAPPKKDNSQQTLF